MFEASLAVLLTISCLALLAFRGRLRLLFQEFPNPARAAVAIVLLIAILSVSVFYPALTSDQSGHIDLGNLTLPDVFLGHALIVLFLVAWWVLRKPESLRQFLHLDEWVARDVRYGIWLGAMGWVATILISAAVATLVSHVQIPDETPHVPEIMIWVATLPVWQKLIIIFVAMTVEEGFFRAFLQSRFGWIPSSLLFALGHASYGLPLMVVSVLIISLVMGWSFRRNGRLLPCIMAHGTFDAIQLLIIMPFAVHQLQGDLWDTLAVRVLGFWFT